MQESCLSRNNVNNKIAAVSHTAIYSDPITTADDLKMKQ